MSLVAVPFQEIFDQPTNNFNKTSHYFAPRNNFSHIPHVADFKDNETLQKHFRQILRINQPGFPVKIFKLDWFPCLICVPVFHCERCLATWTETDRVPLSCVEENRRVYGQMLAISGTKYKLLSEILKRYRKRTGKTRKDLAKSARKTRTPSGKTENPFNLTEDLFDKAGILITKSGNLFSKPENQFGNTENSFDKTENPFDKTDQKSAKAESNGGKSTAPSIAQFVDIGKMLSRCRALACPRPTPKNTVLKTVSRWRKLRNLDHYRTFIEVDLPVEEPEIDEKVRNEQQRYDEGKEDVWQEDMRQENNEIEDVEGKRVEEVAKEEVVVEEKVEEKKVKRPEKKKVVEKKVVKIPSHRPKSTSTPRKQGYVMQKLEMKKTSKENLVVFEKQECAPSTVVPTPPVKVTERVRRPTIPAPRVERGNSRVTLAPKTIALLPEEEISDFVEETGDEFYIEPIRIRDFNFELTRAYWFSYFPLLKKKSCC